MFKALLVGMAMLIGIGIVFVGTTNAAADTTRQSTGQILYCSNDMHWSPCLSGLSVQ